MKTTVFRPYKRLYRSAPGASPAVPASARPGRVSLLAITTDTMGNLPGNRLQGAAELGEGDTRPQAARDVKGLSTAAGWHAAR